MAHSHSVNKTRAPMEQQRLVLIWLKRDFQSAVIDARKVKNCARTHTHTRMKLLRGCDENVV